MNLKYGALTLVLLLSGCAQFPAAQLGGTGRYLQSSVNGQLIMQLDTSSAQQCKTLGTKNFRDPGVEVLCNNVSLESVLPYSFTQENILTNEVLVLRIKTMEACKYLRGEAPKEPNASMYKFTECK